MNDHFIPPQDLFLPLFTSCLVFRGLHSLADISLHLTGRSKPPIVPQQSPELRLFVRVWLALCRNPHRLKHLIYCLYVATKQHLMIRALLGRRWLLAKSAYRFSRCSALAIEISVPSLLDRYRSPGLITMSDAYLKCITIYALVENAASFAE